MLCLELLAKALQDRCDTTVSETKGSKEGSLILQEMRKLIESIEELQPNWAYAMERCSLHLRQAISAPADAIHLCTRAIARLEDSNVRPMDDRMLIAVPGVLCEKEEELGHHKLLNLDKAEDRQYLADRMRLQLLQAQIAAEDSASISLLPQREELSRIQRNTHSRKERLVQLYQQGLRRPEKGISAAGNSGDGAGKDDEALRLKRQLIQQEVARAKARELCSQQGQMEMGECAQDDRNGLLRQQQQQMITQQAPLTAQQERMHRRLAKRKDEEKHSLGAPDYCKDVKASVYVSELSGDDLVRCACVRVPNYIVRGG